MDIETALTIIEGCAIGSLSPDSRSCDAMAVVNREIERLEDRLRAARGGCKMLSQGDECDCGLCKRDRKLANCQRLLLEAVELYRESDAGGRTYDGSDTYRTVYVTSTWFERAAKAAGGEHDDTKT